MAMGWDDVQRAKRVEEAANALGFMFAVGRHSYDPGVYERSAIVLKPLDEALPHYSRDAEIMYGTVEQLDIWLRGIAWAREYDAMLKLSTDDKRKKVEDNERNRQLMETIRKGKRVEGEVA